MKILLVATSAGGASAYTYKWSQELIYDEALFDDQATRSNFEKYVKDFDVVIIMAHGTKDAVLGDDGEPMLDKNNFKILENKYVALIACESGAELGELKGPEVMVSFKEPLSILVSQEDYFKKFVLGVCRNFYKEGFEEFIVKFMKCRVTKLAKVIMKKNLECMILNRGGIILESFKVLKL